MAVVYASSSSVYGLQKKVPFAETDKLDEQASLYGATKKSNENIAHAYHNVYGLRVTGLRFFTVVSVSSVLLLMLLLLLISPFFASLCLVVWPVGSSRHGLLLFHAEDAGRRSADRLPQ